MYLNGTLLVNQWEVLFNHLETNLACIISFFQIPIITYKLTLSSGKLLISPEQNGKGQASRACLEFSISDDNVSTEALDLEHPLAHLISKVIQIYRRQNFSPENEVLSLSLIHI